MDRCLFFREFIIIIRGVRYVSLCVCCFIVCVLLKVGGLKGGGLSGCWWTDALDSRGGVSGSGFLFLFVSHSAPEKNGFFSLFSPPVMARLLRRAGGSLMTAPSHQGTKGFEAPMRAGSGRRSLVRAKRSFSPLFSPATNCDVLSKVKKYPAAVV